MGQAAAGPDPALSIDADSAEFHRASAWLDGLGRKHSIPPDDVTRLDLCLNEALANIVEHGGPGARASGISLSFSVGETGEGLRRARVALEDAGKPFSPVDHRPRPAPTSLEEAELGGLGIVMMRSYADEMDYHRDDDRNHFSFAVTWDADGREPVGPFGSQRFCRGPERRSVRGSWSANRRREERRVMGIGWIPLFRDADPSAVNAALADSQVLTVPAGTPLLRPGAANHNVFLLLSGEVAASLDTDLNPEASIRIAPGQCFGELSAIDGQPVSALVVALSDARVLKISREVFWNRLMGLPGVASNLMVTLTERMRRTNELALKSQREQLELVHLRKELDVARQLQISMLPLQRPLFPERREVDASGFMEPASNVGGDLFDAFFVDDRHLFLCIGDVSGHGIAAALFMARTIGLLRVLALTTLQPDRLLEVLNDRLCVGNDTNIFVTLYCAFLDVGTGQLVYSNGGHCPPLVSAGGTTRLLELPRGALIGAFPGMSYTAMEIRLDPGDRLFCYTDGVTEAQDAAGTEFSEERCIAIIDAATDDDLPALLDRVRAEVARFTGTSVLDDDCTMLALRRPIAAPEVLPGRRV